MGGVGGITIPLNKAISAWNNQRMADYDILGHYHNLQFTPRGKAREDIEAGTFALEGPLPINTDGGLKCFGHPIGASGLRMMYEEYKQLQGKAGPRQVKDCKFGLTHNLGGMPGSATVSVLIVGV